MDDGVLKPLSEYRPDSARPTRYLVFDPTGEKQSQALRLLLEFYEGDTSEATWAITLQGTEQQQGVVALIEKDTVIAACLYEMAIQIHKDTTRKVVLLKAMKGVSDSLRIRWKLHMSEFEEFARARKCDYIVIQGRAAWLRLNWETIHVWVGRSLSEGENK